jgi:putative tricarboxylic transport membrane protein
VSLSHVPLRRLVTGGVPLALGAAALVAARDLPVGTLTQPGIGMWPFIVSVLLVTSSAIVLLTPNDDGEPFSRSSRRIAVALVALAVFVVLFSRFGFVLPASLLLVFWLRWISRESWRMTLVVTVVAVATLYTLFVTGLGVPFPYDLITGR